MEKPSLDRIWHTFVKLPSDRIGSGMHIDILRFKIRPALLDLKNRGIIDWYSFLIHDKKSGVPAQLEEGLYYIRVALNENIGPSDLLATLPS